VVTRSTLDALQAAGGAYERPHNDCYWVLPGRLLAGAYPELHLDALLAAGVDCFVDLTSDSDAPTPYALQVKGRARWHGFAITDYAVPGASLMRRIVDTLDDELARGSRVYLHCHAGVGRTGTAVGCWLVEQGFTGGEALRLIANKRDALLGQSPETEAQREFVRRWRARQSPP
jgi:atypical dual specificity phosphatase